MTDTCLTTHPCTPARPRLSFIARLFRWDALFRQRHDLKSMTDRQLRDIGVSRDDAQTEAKRPFWDAPDHWQG